MGIQGAIEKKRGQNKNLKNLKNTVVPMTHLNTKLLSK